MELRSVQVDLLLDLLAIDLVDFLARVVLEHTLGVAALLHAVLAVGLKLLEVVGQSWKVDELADVAKYEFALLVQAL